LEALYLPIAEEPCLYQYFLYLVKDKGKLNNVAIKEAQKLWDTIHKVFSIEPETLRLYDQIKKLSNDIYLDKKVKRLGTFETEDNLVLGEQLLAHDMLVICIVINSQPGLVTENPEINWEEQLKINELSDDLKNSYNICSVLQTIAYDPNQVSQQIKKNLSIYNSEKISTCILDFGKLWRFGKDHRYLITIERQAEEAANKFLANNFAYILTLISKIEKHYLLAINLYKEITGNEEQIAELESKLYDINLVPQLENKKEEVQAITKRSTNNFTYLKDCGNNIYSNLINLNDALHGFILDPDSDQIFKSELELFQEHIENIESWAKVCESSIMRIDKNAADLIGRIEDRIEKLKTSKIVLKTTSKQQQDLKQSREMKIEWGNSYILDEDKLGKSIDIFKRFMKQGSPGLCITRTHPEKLEFSNNIKNVTLKWLSKDTGDDCIAPVPEKISHDITDFFRNNKNSILLLDGLEFLSTNNDFKRVIKFIDHLKDLVVMYKTSLIMPVQYKIFTDDEIALLKKNMIDITDKDIKLDIIEKSILK
jgi:hypothetical protein